MISPKRIKLVSAYSHVSLGATVSMSSLPGIIQYHSMAVSFEAGFSPSGSVAMTASSVKPDVCEAGSSHGNVLVTRVGHFEVGEIGRDWLVQVYLPLLHDCINATTVNDLVVEQMAKTDWGVTGQSPPNSATPKPLL